MNTTSWFKNRWTILAVILFGNLPVVINATLLHVAVPTLTTSLKATGTEVLWIIDIYALMMAGLLVPMGTLADKVGARKVLLTGLFIFLITSVVASLSTTPLMVILSRGAMALGGAMLLPTELAVIRATFTDEKERGLALGSFGAVLAAGGAIGPLAGGFILEHFTWHAVFLINVPFLMIALPLTFFVCPETPRNRMAKWTMGQAALLVVGLLSFIYALKSLFKFNAQVPALLGVMGFGVLLIMIFARKQLKSDRPMFDLNLLKLTPISAGFAVALIVAGALAGTELTIAQELQFALGKSALEAGKTMMPLMLATAVGGPLAGLLIGKLGIRMITSGCLLVASACLAGLGLSDFADSGFQIMALFALLGLSLSMGITASSIVIMSSAPPEKAGSAGSIEGVGFELGLGLGTTLFGLLLSIRYQKSIQVPAQYVGEINPQSLQSIADTMVAAQSLPEPVRKALELAGREAFISAHSWVLLSASLLVALAGVFVFVIFRQVQVGTSHS